MTAPQLVLSDLTLSAIQAEATRAHLKHGPFSMFGPAYTSTQRLAIVAEEAGEASEIHAAMVSSVYQARLVKEMGDVAHELTYDSGGPGVGEGRREELVKELIQVAAMAASWVEFLEGDSRPVMPDQTANILTQLRHGDWITIMRSGEECTVAVEALNGGTVALRDLTEAEQQELAEIAGGSPRLDLP
jgi:hypothetical protein